MQEIDSVAGTGFDWKAVQPLAVAYVGEIPSMKRKHLQWAYKILHNTLAVLSSNQNIDLHGISKYS